jgi:hypothetical protein
VCNGWDGHRECTKSAGLNNATKVSLGIYKCKWNDNIKRVNTKTGFGDLL